MEGEAKQCPSCGAENPVSRVTCQVCHAKIGKKQKEEKKDKNETGKLNLFSKSLEDTTLPERSKEIPARIGTILFR